MSERDDDLSALIKSKATRYAATPEVRARVGAMLAQDGITRVIRKPERGVPFISPWRRWINMGGAFAIGVIFSVTALLVVRGNTEEAGMAQAIVDSHVHSLLSEHLVDVHSSDRHTVKPWFTGKLDYAPPVIDL
ncbi:MAG: anti-sigma factor, partial [Variovorax sp.]